MKNLKAPFLVIALLLNVLLMFANTPPAPPAPGSSTAKSMNALGDGDTTDEDCLSDPLCNGQAGYPIDENLIYLLVGGLVLGLTVIYKNQIKKASI